MRIWTYGVIEGQDEAVSVPSLSAYKYGRKHHDGECIFAVWSGYMTLIKHRIKVDVTA